MQTPVMVMNTNSKRESGRKAQLANIQAAKVIHFLQMRKHLLSQF
jgi:T-complex protein 1 subunit gamma